LAFYDCVSFRTLEKRHEGNRRIIVTTIEKVHIVVIKKKKVHIVVVKKKWSNLPEFKP
jgi:hypothetical protein